MGTSVAFDERVLGDAGAILWIDGDGRVRDANEAAERLFGAERAALAGRAVDELLAGLAGGPPVVVLRDAGERDSEAWHQLLFDANPLPSLVHDLETLRLL